MFMTLLLSPPQDEVAVENSCRMSLAMSRSFRVIPRARIALALEKPSEQSLKIVFEAIKGFMLFFPRNFLSFQCGMSPSNVIHVEVLVGHVGVV